MGLDSEKGSEMSDMIQCDSCKKMFYTDCRSEKGAYVLVKIDDPLCGYSWVHLCRKCYRAKFPFMFEEEEEVEDEML